MQLDNCPLVTIITISFNSVRTLERTIQSVLAQTYPNIEYIVIDGGSIDGTREVIEKYTGRLALWSSETDLGISDAFNKGVSKASGRYIGILNSDDAYLPDSVKEIVRAFSEHPEAGFVFGDQIFVDANDNILFCQQGDPDYHKKIKFGMPSIPHPTTFVRFDVYERCGTFAVEYKTAMDYELLLRFHLAGVSGYYVPKMLAAMRVGGASDRHFIHAYAEVRAISIRYGLNVVLADVLFGCRVIKTFFRRRFEQWGLVFAVRIFRRMFNRQFTYK